MRFTFASLLTHGLIVGAIAWFLAHDSGHVEGTTGLAGNTRTRFDVTMEKTFKEPMKKVMAVREGLELPTEVKNKEMREIEEPSEKKVAGDEGQAGGGAEVSARLGDSDRTNRLGLYLQKMQQKIQGNLGPAGYVQFPTHAKLLLDLKRDGNVNKIAVIESSGDDALDRLAIRAVQKSVPFDPWERDQQIQLPVVFR